MRPHLELDATTGTPVGRDPRRLTVADLESFDRPRISRGDAIRAKCLDCCCGNAAEVRRCSAIDCALWPFRMGTDPYRSEREMTDEQRAAAAERMNRARQARLQKETA